VVDAAERVRVAVVQAAPAVFNRDASLDRVAVLTGEAAGRGAKLVLFPEAFVSGYPQEMTFEAILGRRTERSRDDFRRYWETAIDVPGPGADRLGEIAAANDVYLVIGVIERDRGTLYCTALFFAPDGSLLGRHRKLMPTALERTIWGFGDGSTMPVFDTPVGRIGAVICWENYMPLMRAAMYAKGIQIYCAPTLDDLETWVATVRHIAKEGRVFVLSACQYLRRIDCPPDYQIAIEGDAVLMRGGSCIVGPDGNMVAGPNWEGPAILEAELDLREIVRGKYDLDVVGHYARPDVFELRVDERSKRPVVFTSDEVPPGPN
jgi:nitrilase